MAMIEFYIGHEATCISVVVDSAVPRAGEFVNIRKVTYLIKRVTWAVDWPDSMGTKFRANVEMEIAP